MGFLYAGNLKAAGDYVLKLLKEKNSVRYSEHFYDGSEELPRKLRIAFGFEPDDEWNSVEILVDEAVGELAVKGIVETTILPEKMMDGENDYQIALTEKGKAFLASGQEFKYWDLDL